MVLHPPLFHSKLRHVCFLVFIFPAQYFLFEERKQVLIPIFLLHFLHFTEPLSILVGGCVRERVLFKFSYFLVNNFSHGLLRF